MCVGLYPYLLLSYLNFFFFKVNRIDRDTDLGTVGVPPGYKRVSGGYQGLREVANGPKREYKGQRAGCATPAGLIQALAQKNRPGDFSPSPLDKPTL